MRQKTPAEFIDWLANYLYAFPGGTDATALYLHKERKLDMGAFSFPWVLTDDNADYFRGLQQYLPPRLFTNCLFVPVVDVAEQQPPKLSGFDIRYLGTEQRRLRWMKIRRDEANPMLYNPAALLSPETYVVVTESSIFVWCWSVNV